MTAFWDLTAAQAGGMGRSAIPYSEILAYLQLHPQDAPAAFAARIRLLDAELMNWQAQRDKARGGSK